jgi:CelD/BcsL family acetyltransferase involved in cellulose biosynthesis
MYTCSSNLVALLQNMQLNINGQKFEVITLRQHQLNDSLIQQWSDLEQRSVDGNAYLSPYFILPSIKYLTPNTEIIFVFVTYVTGNTSTLTGVGVFEYWRGTKRLPLPHFKTYRSPHSYLSGLLVDEKFVDSTLSAFFAFLGKSGRFSCGVEFINRTEDTMLAKRIAAVALRLNIPWRQYNEIKRAILTPGKLSGDYINSQLSNKTKKTLRYASNLLEKSGEVSWSVVGEHRVDTTCIDNFLRLEHMGWKGENGTSLLSNPAEESFFREMVNGFAQHGRVFFTELKVNGRTVASTVNLISSNIGFAFKIGWDPEFAAASPGTLNEVEFIKNAAALYPHLEYIDSGAEEGSFIEKLWVDRYALVSGFYATKPFVVPIIACYNYFRRIKQQLIASRN